MWRREREKHITSYLSPTECWLTGDTFTGTARYQKKVKWKIKFHPALKKRVAQDEQVDSLRNVCVRNAFFGPTERSDIRWERQLSCSRWDRKKRRRGTREAIELSGSRSLDVSTNKMITFRRRWGIYLWLDLCERTWGEIKGFSVRWYVQGRERERQTGRQADRRADRQNKWSAQWDILLTGRRFVAHEKANWPLEHSSECRYLNEVQIDAVKWCAVAQASMIIVW